jgi:hypothetical protein
MTRWEGRFFYPTVMPLLGSTTPEPFVSIQEFPYSSSLLQKVFFDLWVACVKTKEIAETRFDTGFLRHPPTTRR